MRPVAGWLTVRRLEVVECPEVRQAPERVLVICSILPQHYEFTVAVTGSEYRTRDAQSWPPDAFHTTMGRRTRGRGWRSSCLFRGYPPLHHEFVFAQSVETLREISNA